MCAFIFFLHFYLPQVFHSFHTVLLWFYVSILGLSPTLYSLQTTRMMKSRMSCDKDIPCRKSCKFLLFVFFCVSSCFVENTSANWPIGWLLNLDINLESSGREREMAQSVTLAWMVTLTLICKDLCSAAAA